MPFRPAWPGQPCSLGFGVIEFLEWALEPLAVTPAQERIIVRCYELDPETRRRIVRRAAVRRPKGWGKSPLAGMFALAELVGPVVFDGFDAEGQPVGREPLEPWVQCSAVTQDQTGNVMDWLVDRLRANPDVVNDLGLEVARSVIRLSDRPESKIEVITSGAAANEGDRSTFVIMDQTESWFASNGGKRLAAVIRRNVGKMSGWTLELQNAPKQLDGSVAWNTEVASEKATRGVLFDTIPPGPEPTDMGDRAAMMDRLREVYEIDRGHGAWIDLERLLDEALDPDTEPEDARGFYLNETAPKIDAWIEGAVIEARATAVTVTAEGAVLVLGMDGAETTDGTAVVACEITAEGRGDPVLLGYWEPPPGPAGERWKVPRKQVDDLVKSLLKGERVQTRAGILEGTKVRRMYVDPPYWRDELREWQNEFGELVLAFDTFQPSRIGPALEEFHTGLGTGRFKVDDEGTLLQHLGNARKVVSRGYTLITKQDRRSRIDCAIAAVLARRAWSEMVHAVTDQSDFYDI